MSDVLSRAPVLAVLHDAAIGWLIGQGVPPAAMYEPDELLRGDVVFVRADRFIFADEIPETDDAEPIRAVIFITRDTLGLANDLVAWSNRAGMIGSWLGRAPFLGNPYVPRLGPYGSLTVHPSPLEWLRDNREGLVLVDEAAAGAELVGLGPFATDDPAFAEHLDAALTQPAPSILVFTD